MNKIIKYLLLIFMIFIIICLAILIYINLYSKNKIYIIENIPNKKIAVVFGAQVKPDGTLSEALKNRVDTAIQLYNNKKIEKMLFTGDNSTAHYDEVTNMKKYAVSQGIPENVITLDYAGFRTYDSCYRSNEVFGVNNAILVTQNYHLYRAIYTCNKLGVDSIGVIAPNFHGAKLVQAEIREFMAQIEAFIDVNIHQKPKFLGNFEGIQ